MLALPGLAVDAPAHRGEPGAGGPKPPRITLQDYRDRVYASWLGQVVGNIYGLSYEFQFIDEAGPDDFPYGYGPSLERAEELDGAYSDDDTDIEYMYLLQMERHGIEPGYASLRQAWMHHVRDRIWVANRSALALMRAGYSPPITGNREYNPNWFQIDPQLVNEIWAVTAPGMVRYATEKSAWAARITSDSFGTEPTVHYAAMYAAAFFESDVERLIDIGLSALPTGSRYAEAVEEMKRLHRLHPDDWQAARRAMADRYYGEFDYNRDAWPVVDAVLNGACGILALLYGGGDFQRTIDLASALGFDADNQAATLGGLLGIVHGVDGIPESLLYPLGRDRWSLPFNDRYVNVTRHDLPDASLQDIAARMAAMGEAIVLARGGRTVEVDGVRHLEINPQAHFEPPFELVRAPTLLAEAGRPFRFRLDYREQPTEYRIRSGRLPRGLALEEGVIGGIPAETGSFPITVAAHSGGAERSGALQLRVHARNLAPLATEVLSNPSPTPDRLEWIRDGAVRGATYYNRAPDDRPRRNWYGYRWEAPQRVATLVYNPGLPEEWGGWFTSLEVEYLDANGEWRRVDGLRISPPMDFDNSQWLKGAYIDHSLAFDAVETTAIRMVGEAGGIEQDARNGGERRYYTAISELAVYPD